MSETNQQSSIEDEYPAKQQSAHHFETMRAAVAAVPLQRAPIALAILLIVGGVFGLVAAFELTLDKFALLQDSNFVPSCSWSVLYDCRTNLRSQQGAVFGFPNPLIGLIAFPAPIIVGTASLAGVAFPKWFWATFTLGMAFAITFVAWLITQSIFVLTTLCPWCMVVWACVIPMSIATTLFSIARRAIPLGHTSARIATTLFSWTPTLALLAYTTFAVIAQVRLDVLHRL